MLSLGALTANIVCQEQTRKTPRATLNACPAFQEKLPQTSVLVHAIYVVHPLPNTRIYQGKQDAKIVFPEGVLMIHERPVKRVVAT